MATAVGVEGLKHASDFASDAGKVFASVKAGLDLLNSLKTYKDLPSKAIDELLDGFKDFFLKMGTLLSNANAAEQQADTFLGTMQRAAQKIAQGLAIGGAMPTIGGSINLAPNTGGFANNGGAGSGIVNYITVTGNTMLSDSPGTAQQIADIITPAQNRAVGYSIG